MPNIYNPHASAGDMSSTHLTHIARKDEISDKDAGGMHSAAQGPQRLIFFPMRDAAQDNQHGSAGSLLQTRILTGYQRSSYGSALPSS